MSAAPFMLRLRSLRVPLALSIAFIIAPSFVLAQGLTVGASSTFSLGSATLALGCTDLNVGGTFNANAGAVVGARDVNIAGGGALNGGSGTFNVTRNWTNGGTFTAGSSAVNLLDGCSAGAASISGNNTFDTLSITTTSGKSLQVASGSTQTINTDLTLQGSAGNLLEIRSSSAGVNATFTANGSIWADFVDVDDIYAEPEPIVAEDNSILGSNTTGWSLFILTVPALSLVAIASMTLAMVWAARRRLAQQAL